MWTIFLIALTGMFAYHGENNYKSFGGASALAHQITGIVAHIGYITYYVTLIWSFWVFDWWIPIVIFVSMILVDSLTAIIFQGTAVGKILTLLLTIPCAVCSIVLLALS